VPNIYVRIGGANGACNLVRIYDASPDAFEPMCQYCAGAAWRRLCEGARARAGAAAASPSARPRPSHPRAAQSRTPPSPPIPPPPPPAPPPADYFWRWTHYLAWYGGASTQSITNGPSSFQGCGGNSVDELEYVEFVAPYNWGGDRWVCLDRIVLA
jgi:hypothetical protein